MVDRGPLLLDHAQRAKRPSHDRGLRGSRSCLLEAAILLLKVGDKTFWPGVPFKPGDGQLEEDSPRQLDFIWSPPCGKARLVDPRLLDSDLFMGNIGEENHHVVIGMGKWHVDIQLDVEGPIAMHVIDEDAHRLPDRAHRAGPVGAFAASGSLRYEAKLLQPCAPLGADCFAQAIPTKVSGAV